MNLYTLKVVELKKETLDTITICFKQPVFTKILYKAGQYLSLIFRINGRRFIRPYSFSSSPLVDPLLEITVKRIFNGVVSNHIHDNLKVGDLVEVFEPMGDFIFESRQDVKEIFFWGGGSGITPLISLIKEILFSSPDLKLNLIYCNRNSEAIIFYNTIEEMRKCYPTRLTIWHFLSEPVIRKDNPYIIEERINSRAVEDIIKDVDTNSTIHYICGPFGLKASVQSTLQEANFSFNRIISEEFEIVKDPIAFEDVYTRTISLDFKGETRSLEVVKGKSVLEAALEAGLDLPYSCQTGNCNICKAICKNGELRMIGTTKKRNNLMKEEYLLCCSHPLSDNVHIEL